MASNRGPLSFAFTPDGGLVSKRGGGGLVSALSTLSGDDGAVWICAAMSSADRSAVATGAHLEAGLPLRMLDIDPLDFAAAYDGIANGVLWFIAHLLYPLATAPAFDAAFAADWEAYRRFNQAFAGALAAEAAPGATVLVQDYHLSLVPAQLRELRPDLRIGHFSHTPWAPPDYFRVLPREVAAELLTGILGADRAGFLSQRWADAFGACCEDVLGYSHVDGVVTGGGNSTMLAVHALGVDGPALRSRAAAPDVPSLDVAGVQVIARVDRAELSKNIVRGILAIGELLRLRPEWLRRVVHVAIAYPSRGGVPAYAAYMEDVKHAAAAVNAEFGDGDWQPVDLILEDDYPQSLGVLKRADVLLINPIRDGMNLVAKEGPLLSERDAVLVLSTQAGAADELSEGALMVNPFDVSETARALQEALSMPAGERARRALLLREAAGALPPQAWFAEQRDALGA